MSEDDVDVPLGKAAARMLGVELAAGGITPEHTDYVSWRSHSLHAEQYVWRFKVYDVINTNATALLIKSNKVIGRL